MPRKTSESFEQFIVSLCLVLFRSLPFRKKYQLCLFAVRLFEPSHLEEFWAIKTLLVNIECYLFRKQSKHFKASRQQRKFVLPPLYYINSTEPILGNKVSQLLISLEKFSLKSLFVTAKPLKIPDRNLPIKKLQSFPRGLASHAVVHRGDRVSLLPTKE